jgi:hypothetical protein
LTPAAFAVNVQLLKTPLRVCLNNHFLPIGVVVEWAVG